MRALDSISVKAGIFQRKTTVAAKERAENSTNVRLADTPNTSKQCYRYIFVGFPMGVVRAVV